MLKIAGFCKPQNVIQYINKTLIKLIIKEIKADFIKISQIVEKERDNIEKYSNLPGLNKLIEFMIIGEDRRFYSHPGFDILAIFRAIRNRIIYNKIEGASTIEQQLVRVLTNQYNRTFKRKLKEIILATQLKKILTKKEIALLYLKLAYYGTSKQGLEMTLSADNLSINSFLDDYTCATIISRLKYPEPKINSQKRNLQIATRTRYILKKYRSNG